MDQLVGVERLDTIEDAVLHEPGMRAQVPQPQP